MKRKHTKKVKYIFVDLETKSSEPIENGATKYFADEDADWLICSYKHRKKRILSKTNFAGGNVIPDEVLNFDGIFVAHNWFFEWSFFNQFYPGTNAANWRNWLCTANMARWFGICAPRAKLEDVSIALGIGEKMPEGKIFINRYCVPQKDGLFISCDLNSADREQFIRYCETDVELTEKIFDVFDGKGFNIEEFRAAQAINVRGVPVDVDAARFLVERKENDKAHATEVAEKIAGRTKGGTLILSSNTEFLTYLQNTFGIDLPNAQSKTLDALDFSNHPRMSEIERVLYVRKLLVARAGDKAQLILDREFNGRVYDATVFHAAGTGRFQSWGVNFFNFSRLSVKDWEAEKYTAPVPALQRGIVCAPKGSLITESDWRGIENYLSLYYAGDTEQLKRIEAGESPYLIFAESLYGEKITKEDVRYVPAKSGVLGCLAVGTKVLTEKRGYVNIESILLDDLLWDGKTWVKHGGTLRQGLKNVIRIESRSIDATPDHWILSQNTWRTSVEIIIEEDMKAQNSVKSMVDLEQFQKNLNVASNAVSVCAAYAELKKKSALINFGKVKDYFAGVVPNQLTGKEGGIQTVALISWLIQNLEHVGTCVINTLKKDAGTLIIKTTRGMAVAVSHTNSHPLEIFWNTLLHCAGLINGDSRWTELITMDTMKPETYESCLKKLTMKTEETYDIKDVGKHNCFMTIGGLVHNCGYGAGAKKFSIVYNLPLDEATRVRDGWHRMNQPIVRLWSEFYNAFSFALRHKKTTDVKGFIFAPLGDKSVKVTLPDGHNLYYRDLQIKTDMYGRVQIQRDFQTIHGGLLTENMMQSVCARLLYRALVACENNGLKVFLHVYDSIAIEWKEKKEEEHPALLAEIMKDPPSWATDLKLAVDQKTGRRWSK